MLSISTDEEHRSIRLSIAIGNVELPNQVLDVLEHALNTAPISCLMLINNMLGNDGVKYVAHVVEANQFIRDLVVGDVFSSTRTRSGVASRLSLINAATTTIIYGSLRFSNAELILSFKSSQRLFLLFLA